MNRRVSSRGRLVADAAVQQDTSESIVTNSVRYRSQLQPTHFRFQLKSAAVAMMNNLHYTGLLGYSPTPTHKHRRRHRPRSPTPCPTPAISLLALPLSLQVPTNLRGQVERLPPPWRSPALVHWTASGIGRLRAGHRGL